MHGLDGGPYLLRPAERVQGLPRPVRQGAWAKARAVDGGREGRTPEAWRPEAWRGEGGLLEFEHGGVLCGDHPAARRAHQGQDRLGVHRESLLRGRAGALLRGDRGRHPELGGQLGGAGGRGLPQHEVDQLGQPRGGGRGELLRQGHQLGRPQLRARLPRHPELALLPQLLRQVRGVVLPGFPQPYPKAAPHLGGGHAAAPSRRVQPEENDPRAAADRPHFRGFP
mmetsp:Transcript_59122/g.133865  ORF Transcript_59122/g.133865 Transcript_59122/m.133865 type:complete len:225 (-) Transcript_59122:778-1452(-)